MLYVLVLFCFSFFFFFQAEDGIRDVAVTGVQTCALPISSRERGGGESAPQLHRGRLLRPGGPPRHPERAAPARPHAARPGWGRALALERAIQRELRGRRLAAAGRDAHGRRGGAGLRARGAWGAG